MPTSETNLEMEREEQRRWRLRDEHADLTIFDQLVANEFLAQDTQKARQDQEIGRLIQFVTAQVPYYQKLFESLDLTSSDVLRSEDLTKLPILTKRDVYEFEDALQPGSLPQGSTLSFPTMSSGSTGRPTRVAHTQNSHALFGILRQRALRIFKFNPDGRFATIRLASQMPRGYNGNTLPNGATHKMRRWQYCGKFFHTGPAIFFSVTNPVDELIAWLNVHQPQYLMTYPETLEHLVFAAGDAAPMDHLQGAVFISEQLTPSMRRRIEGAFACPVQQGYGLNEIGAVAFLCQAGRYHVHAEHCFVEIVDEDNQPCEPGSIGRILVTGLKNPAMPLIRYDTDDLALALQGPCPCGRTLPSFGEVSGRYSRIAFLPENTLGFVGTIRQALEDMPRDLALNLRKFQVHQFKDGSFELRLQSDGAIPATFKERVIDAWQEPMAEDQPALTIIEVDDIDRNSGGKFQDFTSDFVPHQENDD